MQVKAEDLAGHLAGSLKGVYLVSGDETLIVEESCDAIIAAAREAGYSERSVHYVEAGFRWADLSHDAASMSLFAERKVLDVRIPVKKFDREGSEALRAWAEDLQAGTAEPETILLLRTTRLEPRQRSSAWFKALDKVGAITLIWPMAVNELPRWLQGRLRARGLDAEREAVQYLADRVEGNLLAAAQEIEKLALLSLPQPVTVEALVEALEDASHFTSFDLVDAALGAQPQRVVKILGVLREEGVALFAILGALTSQLRRAGDARGLPPQRRRLMAAFSDRVPDVSPVLAECAIIDQQGKGQLPGDAWISLEQLCLRLAMVRTLPLPSQDQRLLRHTG